MANKDKFSIGTLKELAKKGITTIDVEEIKNKTKEATTILVDKAGEAKEAVISIKEFNLADS